MLRIFKHSLIHGTVIQRIYSRPPNFDGAQMPILTVDKVVNLTSPPGLWLNIQVDDIESFCGLFHAICVGSVTSNEEMTYVNPT